MKVIVDTNVLVRALVHDDPAQGRAADKLLKQASVIAVSLPCLCELVWVLRRVYEFTTGDIVVAIKALLELGAVAVNRPAAEAGLAMLEGGGDFADGVIAYEGRWLGGEVFVSFDRKAVALLTAGNVAARLVK